MSLNVCVECGTRVRRLVRKLQFDNYCLEKCVSAYLCTIKHVQPECKNDSDKYLEYERNLKILNIILCFPQIYRHIFFNLDSIKKIKSVCLIILTSIILIIYWHENRERLISRGIEVSTSTSHSTVMSENRSLKILQTIDYPTALHSLVQTGSYIFTVVFATYIFKRI